MTVAALAKELLQARTEARIAGVDGWSGVVTDVDAAYRVQTEIAAQMGGPVRGWKVTALAEPDQRKYGAARPLAGPLLAHFVQEGPATVARSQFVAPMFECEIAFVLGTDLPQRDAPYHRHEIGAAVSAVVAGLEIADCRVAPSSTDLMKMADAMGNGVYVVGTPVRDWHRLDLTDIAISVTIDGDEAYRGNSARILGNPLLAVVALANAQPLPLGGLKKGQIVTTGSCVTPVPLRDGTYVADLGPLGTVRLTVAG
ncbi:MAG: fumarylacetoacetate hydrolase family protein [Rhodoplanes sp.]|uniref:2-keto-4-pentenoate hydratase n=1 Tax=Rhodoplanes sp. TaxID=1968906 RepID=UPI00183EEB37|nr:fumarylacetoacetate hydrolase family protein [Rhodoplanes sp.]NVO15233.1 fumarylacetoacetate hydrolase family protein [Rhodoplanes sp.]